jgi:hypothetical protein
MCDATTCSSPTAMIRPAWIAIARARDRSASTV